MTVLTTFSNGGSLKDYRDTFNSILTRLAAIEGGTPTPTPTPTPSAPTGFALNGSTNPALKAMLSNAGSTFSTISVKGDSTTAGAGGGDDAYLGNAAHYRPSAVLATELTTAGFAAYDSAFVGDNGCSAGNTNVALIAYDPRVSFTGGAWPVGALQSLAGGGFFNGSGQTSYLQFQETCSGFEVVLYMAGAATIAVALDGAAPSGITATNGAVVHDTNRIDIPSSGTGFVKVTIPAALGAHTLAIAVLSGAPLLSSVRALRSAGIGILNHAA